MEGSPERLGMLMEGCLVVVKFRHGGRGIKVIGNEEEEFKGQM